MMRTMNDLELTVHKLKLEAAGAVGENVVIHRDENGAVMNVEHFPNNAIFKNCLFEN